MFVDYFTDVFKKHEKADAIIWQDRVYSYGWLLKSFSQWMTRLRTEGIAPHTVVTLETDFSPNGIALLLALIEQRCVVAPLTDSLESRKKQFRQNAQAQVWILLDKNDDAQFHRTSTGATHELLTKLKRAAHPGLILFTSGSTGEPKAILHDLSKLLEKYKKPGHSLRTIAFLLFDHIGGLDTLFYNLANASGLITVQSRRPDAVCAAIEKHKAQVLPVSPSFLSLLLISQAYEHYDLSSLEIITYGAEVMLEATLQRLTALFPKVKILQKYGATEIGTLQSKSKTSNSLWLKLAGEGFQARVVDGMLEVKSESAMLGYLNAPSPFTEDGWFKTGDVVEIEGEYLKVLGRQSEMINIGGEKVYPAEIENVISRMEGVEEAVVQSEPNSLTGQILVARVKVNTGESLSDFRKRIFIFCKGKMPPHKIPQKIVFLEGPAYGRHYKKIRRQGTSKPISYDNG